MHFSSQLGRLLRGSFCGIKFFCMKIHFRRIRVIEWLVLASYVLLLISVFFLNISWDSGLGAVLLLAIFITSILTLYQLRSYTFVLWPFNIAIGFILGVLVSLSNTAPYFAQADQATFPVDVAPLARILGLILFGVVLFYLAFTFFFARKDFFKSLLFIVLSFCVELAVMYFF